MVSDENELCGSSRKSCCVCGGTLGANNQLGVCRRTPACALERSRRQKPKKARRFLCGACGTPTNSETGFCSASQECRNAGSAAYRKLHPDTRKDATAKYREANRPALRAQGRQYSKQNADRLGLKRRNNAEQKAEYDRNHYQHNASRKKAQARDYARANPDKVEAGRRRRYADPAGYEKLMVIQRRARARKRGVPHSDWTRPQILEQYGAWCYLCCSPIDTDDWHADHVWPISLGGWDAAENIRPTHASCNIRKNKKFIPLLAWLLLTELGGRHFHSAP